MAKNDFINAESVIKSLTEAFLKHEKAIEESAIALNVLNKEYTKLPSDYIKAQKEILDLQIKRSRAEKEVQNALKSKSQAEAAAVRTSEANRRAIEAQNKAYDREQQKLAAAQNLYNKTQQQLNSIQAAYNNLATRKERYNNLTEQEERRLQTLQKVTEKYNATLKGVDATVGKHTRNVGNYASAFNPLSNSINQLTREAPAFANSIQTGFMAISNNLPVFFDAISNTQKEIKALRAEGQKVPGLFQQLTSSLFSFGTALSVGVTLLTLYGKEIVAWVSELFNADAALEDLTKRQKEFNAAKLSGRKDAQSEIIELKKYLAVAKDVKLSDDERRIALEALRKQYPFYFKNLTDAQILSGNYAEAERKLMVALEKRKEVEKKTELNVANKQRIIDIETELDALNKSVPVLQKRLELRREQAKGDAQFSGALANAENKYNSAVKQQSKLRQELNAIKTAEKLNDEDIIRLKKETIGLEDKEEKSRKQKIKQLKEVKELEQVETNSAEAFNRNISAIEEQLKVTSRLNNATGELNPKYAFLEFQLKLLKDAYEALYGEQKKQEEVTKKQVKFGTEEYYEGRIAALKNEQKALADSPELYKLYERAIEAVQIDLDILRGKTKETTEELYDFKEFFKSFVDEFGSSSGFSKMLFLFSEDFKKFEGNAKASALAISDAFQEAFNTISQYSEANYQRELSRLSAQRDLSIQFAGDSATAKAEIERQYEAKRRQLERQKAEQQKKLAIFNAVIDTAQAVVAALPNIPLAVIIGALGAAQIALIASQPIPAYAEGTLNHSGGSMLINDGKGSNYTETVVTPDGKAKQYKGRNVLVDAPKGTKVFTHSQWNDELNGLLTSQNIGYGSKIFPTFESNYNGLTKEDLNAGISKLASVIQSKASIEIVRDAKGERIFQREQGQRKEIQNARLHIKGFDV